MNEKEGLRTMNASRLPLPLQLTEPVLLVGDLDTQVRAGFASNKYDPKTQLCWGGDSETSSSAESESISGILVIDVQFDFVIDDNEF